jgi:transcription initiation factor IIE alpha subunit
MKTAICIAKVRGKDFRVYAQELVTGRTAIIAQTGAGKSWTIGVICEQLCKNNIGFCIIDTEGEYFSLKEKFQLLWVGKDPACDIDLDKVDMKELVEAAVKDNVPMIFDVSDVTDEKAAVATICGAIYEVESALRIPYLLIIEEADKFVPQRGEGIREIEDISRRGRKRGVGLLLATQRPAFVNKNVLSQCDNQLIGKLTTEADLAAVNLFFASRREMEELPKLKPGEFFALGNFVRGKARIRVIGRETTHKGLTPKLLPKPTGKVSDIKEMLMAPIVTKTAEVTPIKTKLRAFLPKISKEELLRIAETKKRKKFGLFGPKEMLTSTELHLHPLVFVEIKYIKGVIRESVKKSSFILDGLTGDQVEIEKGFVPKKGFADLLGLGETVAKVLIEIHKSKRATVTDLEAKTGMSEGTLRAAIEKLSELKLITYTKAGHAKVYILLEKLTLPHLEHHVDLELPEETSVSGVRVECKLSEQDLRDALKAIEPTCEVTRLDVLYYPIYIIRFPNRTLKIDALTGKIV